jgi:hypothetical protein
MKKAVAGDQWPVAAFGRQGRRRIFHWSFQISHLPLAIGVRS